MIKLSLKDKLYEINKTAVNSGEVSMFIYAIDAGLMVLATWIKGINQNRNLKYEQWHYLLISVTMLSCI